MLFAFVLLTVPPEVLPEPRPVEPFLPGIYHVTGEVSGTEYKGVCVVKRVNAAFVFRFMTDSGISATIGMRDGATIVCGGSTGVTRFKIEVDKEGKTRMVGEWTDFAGNSGTETLTWLKD